MVSGVRIPLFPLGLGHSQELIQAFPGFVRTPFLAQAHTRAGPSALAGLVPASGRGAAVASSGRLLAARVRMAAPAPGCRCCPLREEALPRSSRNATQLQIRTSRMCGSCHHHSKFLSPPKSRSASTTQRSMARSYGRGTCRRSIQPPQGRTNTVVVLRASTREEAICGPDVREEVSGLRRRP